MIVGIYGLAGAGKTLMLTRQGSTYDVIISNYKLKEKYFFDIRGWGRNRRKVFKKIFYVKDVEDFFKYNYMDLAIKFRKEGLKVVLLIDEAGLFFPSTTFRQMPASYMYLFAQHRKLGIDFIYDAQSPIQVNKYLRVNTMWSYIMGHLGSLFYFAVYEKDKIRNPKYILWKGFFIGGGIDYLRYNTMEMLAGADWYIRNVEEVKKVVQILLP